MSANMFVVAAILLSATARRTIRVTNSTWRSCPTGTSMQHFLALLNHVSDSRSTSNLSRKVRLLILYPCLHVVNYVTRCCDVTCFCQVSTIGTWWQAKMRSNCFLSITRLRALPSKLHSIPSRHSSTKQCPAWASTSEAQVC